MLFLSLSIWAVLVYSIMVVFTGNQAYRLVHQVPGTVRRQAAAYLEHEQMPDDETTALFIRKFLRVTTTAFALFLLEMGVTVYFIFSQPKHPLPWLILYKNIMMVALGFSLNTQTEEATIFDSVLDIPPWALWLERFSSLLSAIGFLVLFLVAHRIVAL